MTADEGDGPKTHLHGRVGRTHPGLLGACTIGAAVALLAILVAVQAGAASTVVLFYVITLAPVALAIAWWAFHHGSVLAWKNDGDRIRFETRDAVSDDVVREDVRVEPVADPSAARRFYGADGYEHARLAQVEIPRRNGWVRLFVVDERDVPELGAWLGIEPGSLRRFRFAGAPTSGAVALVAAAIVGVGVGVLGGVVPVWAAALVVAAGTGVLLRAWHGGDRVVAGVDGLVARGSFVPWSGVAGAKATRGAVEIARSSGPPIALRGRNAGSARALCDLVETTLERAAAPLDVAALVGDPYRAADASADDLGVLMQHPLTRTEDRARAARLLLERAPDARPLVEEMRRSLLAPGARAALDAELGPTLTLRAR